MSTLSEYALVSFWNFLYKESVKIWPRTKDRHVRRNEVMVFVTSACPMLYTLPRQRCSDGNTLFRIIICAYICYLATSREKVNDEISRHHTITKKCSCHVEHTPGYRFL